MVEKCLAQKESGEFFKVRSLIPGWIPSKEKCPSVLRGGSGEWLSSSSGSARTTWAYPAYHTSVSSKRQRVSTHSGLCSLSHVCAVPFQIQRAIHTGLHDINQTYTHRDDCVTLSKYTLPVLLFHNSSILHLPQDEWGGRRILTIGE